MEQPKEYKTTADLLCDGQVIVALLCSEEGADPDVIAPMIEDFIQQSEDKVGACFHVTRRMESESDFIGEEIARLQARKSTIDGQVKHVKLKATELLKTREEIGEEPKVKTPTYTAWLQKDTPKLIGPENVDEWPKEWTRTKVEPDRAGLSAAIRKGLVLPGFYLEEKRSVRFK